MRYLIVNGDDLGLSSGVNRGIAEAHDHGVVTSASLMVDAPAAEDACALAQQLPRLGLGLHAVISNGDATAELRRQLARFRELVGKPPTHLDSHHNVHLDGPVAATFAGVAREHGFPVRACPPVRYVSDFYGRWDGEAHPEQVSVDSFERIVAALPDGITELGCHPGHVDAELRSTYVDEREAELATLCDPRARAAIEREGIRLVNYSDLPRIA